MPISKTHSSSNGGNLGSSSALINYLDKENIDLENKAMNAPSREAEIEFRSRQQNFFNHTSDAVSQTKAQEKIDANISKLGKNDTKFFAPTLSFSSKELNYLVKQSTDGRKVKSVDELKKDEFEKYNQLLKDYTRSAMDNYAKNFNREDRGLKGGKDLVYFAKIEHQRHFKGTDKEVLNGQAKSGELKPGLQSHVHLIVSRKDKTQKMKISPMANEKSKVRRIGGNTYQVGFDRKSWINENEKSFDKMFDYKRQEIEKFEIQNTLRNGTAEEKGLALQSIKKEKELEIRNEPSYQKTKEQSLER
ncbi:hypothetical protein FEE95_03115 [Maribacter algarum]|uniref:Mobilization protein n=1 Tax=Maribacter algarum (ex Zhang et al. 2020) TaxID=2578118 RepID=A0A5S3PTX6_9FLAO|nr:DUF5712 family protein [Maribacter algarum]TMM58435.1 hypothetical protein FEE95_03115 [Maribacter algarum]